MKKWIFPWFSPDPEIQNKIFLRLAVVGWCMAMLPICIVVAYYPFTSTVTDCYHAASTGWWARGSLYDAGHPATNYLYLPQFAILFSLFNFRPLAGDILWRLCSAVMLSTGIWSWLRRIFGEAAPRIFLAAMLLALPLSIAAIRNGQANVILAGLMLHATASLSSGKWWRAALFIVLAVVAKPVALALALLAPVVYRPLRMPLAVSLVAMVFFPFLFGKPGYVLGQYHAFIANLRSCAVATGYDYADITGILMGFRIQLPVLASQIMRSSAGLLTLGLWWWGARRLREPLRGFWLLTLSACYLMIFNPMNEANSYVILAPALSIWAFFFLDRSWKSGMAWIIVFMALSMGLLPNLLRHWYGNYFALFYHPLMTILFLCMLVAWLWREKSAPPSGASESADFSDCHSVAISQHDGGVEKLRRSNINQ